MSKEEIEKANSRFENGEETLDDLLNYYPNFRIQIEYFDGRQNELDVVEKKYYKKLVDIINKLNNMIDEYKGYYESTYKRFRHLIKSKFIEKYDQYDYKKRRLQI